jgi:hypothetical protein
MKNFTKTLVLAAFTLAVAGVVRAEDSVVGKWKVQFESQIGVQKYTFEFKVDGTNITGRAIGERDSGTNDVALTEIKINQDEISFLEPLKIQDNEVQVEYKGKVAGDELKLHRKVGDFAEYDIVAKRVKATDAIPDAKAAATTETNSPPSKP